MKRLAVYVFWEKNGVVRQYVKTYLEGLKKVCSKIYVVVNGEINKEGRYILEQMGMQVLQRPNEGVDFWAYKTGIDCEGENIKMYDEVILCNCSCYGPVYPFAEMFDTMRQKKIDFWGITEWPLNGGTYTGTWILSYFLVFRSSVFNSIDWSDYWKNLSKVYSREECIDKHETKFTEYFSSRGYTYDVYCHNKPGYLDMTIDAPDQLVAEQRCPIIKRKAFCTEYDRFISIHRGDASKKVFDFIKNNNLYDTNIILDDLLATMHYAHIKDCLQLNYILNSDSSKASCDKKIAVVGYFIHEELWDENYRYLCNLPINTTVYICVPTEKSEVFRTLIKKCNLNSYELCIGDYRGGIFSIFKNIGYEKFSEFDYVCFIHDNEVLSNNSACINEEIARFNKDALLYSSDYISNTIDLFEKHPRIGILIPLNALHSVYYKRYGEEWGLNYELAVSILNNAHIDVPISKEVYPVAPLEGMMWFRPEACKDLFELKNSDQDFAENNPDGTLYHALIRTIPFMAQSRGYCTGTVISTEAAENHIINLQYHLRKKQDTERNIDICSKKNAKKCFEKLKRIIKNGVK